MGDQLPLSEWNCLWLRWHNFKYGAQLQKYFAPVECFTGPSTAFLHCPMTAWFVGSWHTIDIWWMVFYIVGTSYTAAVTSFEYSVCSNYGEIKFAFRLLNYFFAILIEIYCNYLYFNYEQLIGHLKPSELSTLFNWVWETPDYVYKKKNLFFQSLAVIPQYSVYTPIFRNSEKS